AEDQRSGARVDDGPGIAAPDAERIFDPFFTTRREDGGTGLGLTIARSLLAAYGGSIAVAASDGGAAFEMTLPFATQDCRPA
ncbi:MAG: HAMP domain-containing histidine kinase, partial [Sphingomonas sp.]